MNEDNAESDPTVRSLREKIEDFLQERLEKKLKTVKEGDNEKREKLLEEYKPENWIADAVKRVNQIQQVTHAIKFIHPDAKGGSLFVPQGNRSAGNGVVGTHTIHGQPTLDVVGNAAALDVYAFLCTEVSGKTILTRVMENDPALQKAFSKYTDDTKAWIEPFVAITESRGKPTSNSLAKQLYFPVGKGEYHLLAPLFPTSLIHTVWQKICEDRFSEAAKEAHEAKRDNVHHPHGYCEYPGIAIQKFGGKQPQNISQLNTQRNKGENYLLSSCPPTWRSEAVKLPLNKETIFRVYFGGRKSVRERLDTLRGFLKGVKNYTNMNIRNKRAELVQGIVDELLQVAAKVQELDGGWSQSSECRLNIAEQCWLDPDRAIADQSFALVREQGDWVDEICKRFANWLNARLSKSLGDAEAGEWQSVLKKELTFLKKELRNLHLEIDTND